MSAAAIFIIRRRQLIRRFRELGATDAAHAIAFDRVGRRRSWIFDQMARHGVFLSVDGDRRFMDERAAGEFLTSRRNRALIITGALLLVFLLIWFFGLLAN